MLDEIKDALIQRAKTTAEDNSLTPDLPNIDPGAGFNRIRFTFPDGDHTDPTLKGGGKVFVTGIMVITIITEAGVGDTASDAIAAAIAALYPKGLQLTIDSGRVETTGPARIAPGYPDEDSWLTPIRVPYQGIPS